MEKVRPVVAFEIRGRDSARLRDFYAALFNWKIEPRGQPGIASVGPGEGGPEQGVGGVIVAADAPGVSVYVQVRDLEETLREAERLGGRRLLAPTDLPNGPTIARIADPEGNIVGLVQQ